MLFPGFIFGFRLFSSLVVSVVCVMEARGDCGGAGEEVELVETSGRTGDGGEALCGDVQVCLEGDSCTSWGQVLEFCGDGIGHSGLADAGES